MRQTTKYIPQDLVETKTELKGSNSLAFITWLETPVRLTYYVTSRLTAV